ncbi:MAG: hypothetical protein K8H86_04205 [Ignavibacteriaceae bacterium]|nr:hypothetical protein [Ignavibacteriaceae bacterium]
MKKGCFIKSIIILTIITAVSIYLVKKNWKEWVVTPGKNIAVDIAMSSMEDELKLLQQSPARDSLLAELRLYLNNKLEESNEIGNKDLSFVADSIRAAESDSIITESEYLKIKKMLRDRSSQ